MEFWGVEVKPGESLKVDPEMGKLIHISQAALGEVKDAKGAKNIPLRLKIDDKKFVIGSLAAEDRTQIMFDLVFEKEFELSHDWKHGSVFFIGYMADDPISDDEDFDSADEDDEMLEAQQNGEVKEKPAAVKDIKGATGKAVAKKEEEPNLAKVQEDDDESESDSDSSLDEDDDDDDEDSDSDSDDNSSEEEEEELPKKSKKRAAEPIEETPPVPAKKSKSSTPDKTGNKKGHVATPFPSKPGKTPAGSNKAKPNNKPSPKSSHGKGKQGKK